MAIKRERGIPGDEFQAERLEIEESECAAAGENIALKAGRKIIHEDIQDELNKGTLLEDAYAAAMVDRVRVATSSQSALRFDASRFKTDVLNYYNAINVDSSAGKLSWCHMLGW